MNQNMNWTDNSQWIAMVNTSFLFNNLDDITLTKDLLKNVPPPVVFKKGDFIYSQKDFKRALGIILEGCVEITHEDEGRRILMNQLESGGIFGAAALYDKGEEYVADIRAVGQCTVLFLSQEQLTSIMKHEYQVAENYIHFLSGRIRFLNRRIAGFTGGAADRRLALYLIEHREENGMVKLPRSMVALAATLNVGRSSLYRSVDALTDSGVISRGEEGITILDLHRLQAVAE